MLHILAGDEILEGINALNFKRKELLAMVHYGLKIM